MIHEKCPYCGELIQDSAKKCRYCREWINVIKKKHTVNKPENGDSKNKQNLFKRYMSRLIGSLYGYRNRISGFELFTGLISACILYLLHCIPVRLLYALGLGIDNLLGGLFIILSYTLGVIVTIIFVGAMIHQIISRWHDLGRSGAFALLNLIILTTIIMFFIQGNRGSNKYGPDPKNGGLVINGEDVIIETILERKELGTKIESDGNVVFFDKNAKVGDKCIITGKGNKGINGGETGDLIYVISKIK